MSERPAVHPVLRVAPTPEKCRRVKCETRAPTAPVPIEPHAVMGAVQTGAITPEQAGEVMALLLAQAKVLEVAEITQKIEALEQAIAELAGR